LAQGASVAGRELSPRSRHRGVAGANGATRRSTLLRRTLARRLRRNDTAGVGFSGTADTALRAGNTGILFGNQTGRRFVVVVHMVGGWPDVSERLSATGSAAGLRSRSRNFGTETGSRAFRGQSGAGASRRELVAAEAV